MAQSADRFLVLNLNHSKGASSMLREAQNVGKPVTVIYQDGDDAAGYSFRYEYFPKGQYPA